MNSSYKDLKPLLANDDNSPDNDSSIFSNNNDYNNNNATSKSSIRKDIPNILFLMFLYMLQGVPLGLTTSLPFILSSRNVSYADQGTFSFAHWPFSLKLLWAPIVDSIFSQKIGRRKSWLVPIQYLIGIFMLAFSNYVYRILESDDPSVNVHDDILVLTLIFFLFTFLSATQDIAVDGWGLTILSKENLGWASICNNAGATAGILIGNSLFLILESAEFSNYYIRSRFGFENQKYGLVTLKEFMQFFGIVYIVSTTLILLFKKEKKTEFDRQTEKNLSIKTTFKSLWEIISLPPIKKLIFILLTCKIAFATHAIRSLKMIEAGVPKEKLGLMNAPFQIVQIITPILMGNISNLDKPLDLFLKVYPLRIGMTILLAIWVYITPLFKDSNNEYPLSFFIMYAIINGIYSLIFSALALAKANFFIKISDKTIGGTYMTLLNTIANIGVNWPATLALYLIDMLSFKKCFYKINVNNLNSTLENKYNNLIKSLNAIQKNRCSTEFETKNCLSFGAKCVLSIDAFYFLTAICLIIGVFWLICYRNTLHHLESLSKSSWKIFSKKSKAKSVSF